MISEVMFAAVAAFNLLCTGTVETDDLLLGRSTKPYTMTYRIDLDGGQFCVDDCKTVRPIHEVQKAFLVLEKPEDTDTPSRRRSAHSSIDRSSGAHEMAVLSGRGRDMFMIKWTGHCEKQDFTGFPVVTTKF